MTNENKGSGALQAEPLDAGPEQGGSNMGGLGATGAVDRERDPEAEGYSRSKSSAREHAIVEEDHEAGGKPA